MFLNYDKISLRAIEENDWELLYEMLNDQEIENMTVNSHLPVSKQSQIEFAKSYRNNGSIIRLVVVDENSASIGVVILSDINYETRTAELAFKRLPDNKIHNYQRGTMRKACIALLKYAFYEIGLNCITCYSLTNNISSVKLQESLGFIREGVLRERVFKNGAYQDLLVSSILRKDFDILINNS